MFSAVLRLISARAARRGLNELSKRFYLVLKHCRHVFFILRLATLHDVKLIFREPLNAGRAIDLTQHLATCCACLATLLRHVGSSKSR